MSTTLPLRRDIITVANRHFLRPRQMNGDTRFGGLGLPMKPSSLSQSPIHHHNRFFSHRSALLRNEPRRSQPGQPQQTTQTQQGVEKETSGNANENSNPQLPSFSLSSLGLSKNMRILVITLFLIFGSVETWVWCQAIWHWWKGSSDEGRGSGADSTS